MITAKPLKRLDLGDLTPSEGPSKASSGNSQVIVSSSSCYSRDSEQIKDETIKPKLLNFKRTKQLIFLIVQDSPGITGTGVYYNIKQFCKKQNFTEVTSYPEYSTHLRQLVKENKLVRIKVNKVYRYYKHRDAKL